MLFSKGESKMSHCHGAGFKFKVGLGQTDCPFCEGKGNVSKMDAFIYYWHEHLGDKR